MQSSQQPGASDHSPLRNRSCARRGAIRPRAAAPPAPCRPIPRWSLSAIVLPLPTPLGNPPPPPPPPRPPIPRWSLSAIVLHPPPPLGNPHPLPPRSLYLSDGSPRNPQAP